MVTKEDKYELIKRLHDASLAVCGIALGEDEKKHVNTLASAAVRVLAIADKYQYIMAEEDYQAEQRALDEIAPR